MGLNSGRNIINKTWVVEGKCLGKNATKVLDPCGNQAGVLVGRQ